MTTAISDGREPPFIIENFKFKKLSGDKEVSTHTLRWVVYPTKKDDFLKNLPMLDEDGLSLVNVSPSLQGGLLYVSLEYSSDSSSQEAGVVWYSSTRDGLVLHERKTILVSESHAYASRALGIRDGLQPNGASISPSGDGVSATYEATWGPNEDEDKNDGDDDDDTGDEDDDEGSGGDGGGGGDTGDKDDDESTTNDVGISMSSAMGTVTLTGDAALKYRIGEANFNLLESDGGNWRTYLQAIASGSLAYGPLKSYSGQSGLGWQWVSASPFPNQPADDVPSDMYSLLKMAATAQSSGAVSVPVQIYKAEVTSTMKVRAKSQTLALAAVMNKFGSGGGGNSLPSPPTPYIGPGISVQASWQQMGVSTSSGITSTKVFNKYGVNNGGAMYVTEYTINYTTSYETVVTVS